jgi:hypothetical protein
MSQFDDREKAEETLYARKEEQEFKAVARRNKLVGQWAAGLLGLEGDAVEAYATSVVVADFKEAGDEDVIAKLKADFAAKGVDVSDHVIRRTLDDKLEEARAQLGSA